MSEPEVKPDIKPEVETEIFTIEELQELFDLLAELKF